MLTLELIHARNLTGDRVQPGRFNRSVCLRNVATDRVRSDVHDPLCVHGAGALCERGCDSTTTEDPRVDNGPAECVVVWVGSETIQVERRPADYQGAGLVSRYIATSRQYRTALVKI